MAAYGADSGSSHKHDPVKFPRPGFADRDAGGNVCSDDVAAGVGPCSAEVGLELDAIGDVGLRLPGQHHVGTRFGNPHDLDLSDALAETAGVVDGLNFHRT